VEVCHKANSIGLDNKIDTLCCSLLGRLRVVHNNVTDKTKCNVCYIHLDIRVLALSSILAGMLLRRCYYSVVDTRLFYVRCLDKPSLYNSV
jgi:hypothetical protein